MDETTIKKVPTGVKVISVLYFIGAVFWILVGIGSIGGGSTLVGIIASFIPALGFPSAVVFIVILRGIIASFIPTLGFPSAELFIITGLILIAFGILAIFVGRGLWRGKNWARIVAIILVIIGLIMNLVAMIQLEISSSNIVGLIVNLVIGGYLLFSPKVKNAFA